MIVCVLARSSECMETVGRMVMGKSQVIVSVNELLRVNTVALETAVGGAESSDWVDFLFIINSKCTCHFTETSQGYKEKKLLNKIWPNVRDVTCLPKLVLKV